MGIDPPGVIASSIRPSADGRALMIRLYNASGGPVDARVSGRVLEDRAIFLSSPFEDRGEHLDGGRLRLLPFEVATLRIELKIMP